MKVGGTLLIGVGIIIMVLVANGRWDNVWASALGTNISSSNSGSSVSPISTSGSVYNGLASSGATFGAPPSGSATTQSGPRRA